MAKLQIGIELTISDDDDPMDVLEDVEAAVGSLLLDHPEWQPSAVQILSDHDCNDDDD
jgi:hypothetical protein